MRLLLLDEYDAGSRARLIRRWRGTDVVVSKLDPIHARSRALGICLEHRRCTLDELPQALRETSRNSLPTVAVFVPSWRHEATHFADVLHSLPHRPGRPPLILFDTFDQTSSPYFESVPSVDLYLKSQLLRERSLYRSDLAGGFVVADWVQRHLNFDLAGWQFGSRLDVEDESKVALGWSMGASRHYRTLASLARLALPWNRRPFALNRRFSVPDPRSVSPWEWYHEYRRFCGVRVEKLAGQFSMTGTNPIPRASYLFEVARSRLVFSPFGWGEICFRDFEAIALGATLIKPDVSHLETRPEVFIPWETYAPVRWDLDDLGEVCDRLLSEPSLATRLASTARSRLLSYLGPEDFDTQINGMIAGLLPE